MKHQREEKVTPFALLVLVTIIAVASAWTVGVRPVGDRNTGGTRSPAGLSWEETWAAASPSKTAVPPMDARAIQSARLCAVSPGGTSGIRPDTAVGYAKQVKPSAGLASLSKRSTSQQGTRVIPENFYRRYVAVWQRDDENGKVVWGPCQQVAVHQLTRMVDGTFAEIRAQTTSDCPDGWGQKEETYLLDVYSGREQNPDPDRELVYAGARARPAERSVVVMGQSVPVWSETRETSWKPPQDGYIWLMRETRYYDVETGILVYGEAHWQEFFGDDPRDRMVSTGMLVDTNAVLGHETPVEEITPTHTATHTPTPTDSPTPPLMATNTPTGMPTPTETPNSTPTRTPSVFPMPPVPLPLNPSGLRIDALEVLPTKDRYEPHDVVTVKVIVACSGALGKPVELMVRWEEAVLSGGEIGRATVRIDSGLHTEETFRWLIPAASGTVVVTAEVEGVVAQTQIQVGAVVPRSYGYEFELWPSKDHATKLIVTTPEGMQHEFDLVQVKVYVETPGVPQICHWSETEQLYLYVPATLDECLITSFLPWWLEILEKDPARVAGEELLVQVLEKKLKEGTSRVVPLGELVDAAEAMECWLNGVAYPVEGRPLYLVPGKEARLRLDYQALCPDGQYVWTGHGVWSAVVSPTEPSITIRVTLDDNPPVARISSVSPSPAQAGQSVNLSGEGLDPDFLDRMTRCEWKSSLDGLISEGTCRLTQPGSSMDTQIVKLSAGIHTISFRVGEPKGAYSDWTTVTLDVKEPTSKAESLIEKILRRLKLWDLLRSILLGPD